MALGYITGGTVSVSNGSTAVTGVGTAFTNSAAYEFRALGLSVLIASVADDGALTLAEPWPGTTLSASANYQITIVPGASLALQTNLQIRELLAALSLKGEILDGDGVPSAGTGDDGDTYFDETAGNIYRKVDGSWSLRWTGTITSPDVSNLAVITQAAYDALGSKDANTLYAITAA